MKTYEGVRHQSGCYVTVTDDATGGVPTPLDPRFDLRNHSPTGFEWGFAGSGPAQLALAILADALEDDGDALAFYHSFKHGIIALISQRTWEVTDEQVRAWVRTGRLDGRRLW